MNDHAILSGIATAKKIRQQKLYGILFSLGMILVSIFVFGGNRLAHKYEQTRGYFYEIENQLSISSQVDFIWGQGWNMHHMMSNHREVITESDLDRLVQALDTLHHDTDFFNLPTNLVQVVTTIEALHGQRELIDDLTAENAAHMEGILANIMSARHIISNSSFNDRVAVYNNLVTRFPGRLIARVRSIEVLPYF